MPSDPARLLKDLGGLALYYPGQALICRAPRGLQMPIAAAGGDLSRWLAGGGEEMREELVALFDGYALPRPVDDLIRDAYRAAMFNELEVLRYSELNPTTIRDVCEVEGLEHLDAALARGKGAIVLIGHFGANQMIMPALGHLGYPMHQLSAPPPVWAEILRDTRTNWVWERVLERRWALEKRLPVKHINVFRFLRPAFDCLRANEVLGLAFDGGGGQGWTQVSLLGRTANISTQPIQLWRKTGAALLPTVVLRPRGAVRHKVVITAPLKWRRRASRAEENRVNMQSYVDRFAEWVRRYPEHYLQFLLMRRRVRGTDVRPLFTDYPPCSSSLSPGEAQARLRRAGEWEDR
jgi:KDO2-lipid IV(A) lauroyltransferase